MRLSLVHSLLNNRLNEERVKGIVKDVADIEKEFVCHALPNP